MDNNKRRIVFSTILVSIVIGAPISYNWFWPNNNTATPLPASTNNQGIKLVQSDIANGGSSNISSITSNNNNNNPFKVIYDSTPLPQITDKSLRVEKVISGGLHSPTSMEFVGYNNILILEKERGTVRLVSNDTLLSSPILQRPVENNSERGMLGIAVSNTGATTTTTSTITTTNNNNSTKAVFLYYTERNSTTGAIENRIYKYQWDDKGNITGGGQVILNLPGTPGPNHNAGKLAIGPDGMLYAVIGDLNRNGMDQNHKDGPWPDDTSAIFRIDQNGNAVKKSIILSDKNPIINSTLSKYYAYGIRNSFGLAFDPITGKLWDTENGPSQYDEINIVIPGFNSGWEKIQGPIARANETTDVLVQFNGSHYADPVFSWRQPPALTGIDFFNSSKLGPKYTNNIFVGSFNNGTLYFFTVNKDRNDVLLEDPSLQDRVADNSSEASKVTFGTGFKGGITDIKTGPDGYLYILTYSGDLYRIVPAAKP
jgi:aldose sugar dehydrogenase